MLRGLSVGAVWLGQGRLWVLSSCAWGARSQHSLKPLRPGLCLLISRSGILVVQPQADQVKEGVAPAGPGLLHRKLGPVWLCLQRILKDLPAEGEVSVDSPQG